MYQASNFMKTLQVETEFFHAYEQADMIKITVVLRRFANAHKHRHVSTVIFISGTQNLSFVKITFTTPLVLD